MPDTESNLESWRQDPDGAPFWRFHDGEDWTSHTAPMAAGDTPIGPPPPVPPREASAAEGALDPGGGLESRGRPPAPSPPSGLSRTDLVGRQRTTTRSGLSRLFGAKSETQQHAESYYDELLVELVSGRGDVEAVREQLAAAAADTGRSERNLQKLHDRAFVALAERVLDDDILTAAEEAELLETADALGIAHDAVEQRFASIHERLMIARLNDGRLPVIHNPRLLAKRGETVYAEVSAQLMKEVVHRQYRGGGGGVSFPVGLGVRLNTGGFRGKSVVVGTSLEPADAGVLSVTTIRVVFQGQKRTIESRLDKMTGFEVFNDGIRISVSNRQAAALYRVSSGLVVGALINAAVQRNIQGG